MQGLVPVALDSPRAACSGSSGVCRNTVRSAPTSGSVAAAAGRVLTCEYSSSLGTCATRCRASSHRPVSTLPIPRTMVCTVRFRGLGANRRERAWLRARACVGRPLVRSRLVCLCAQTAMSWTRRSRHTRPCRRVCSARTTMVRTSAWRRRATVASLWPRGVGILGSVAGQVNFGPKPRR